MDDNEKTIEPIPEEAERKLRARLRGMAIVLAIFSVPVLIGGWLVYKMKRSLSAERAWAEAELKKEKPDPRAYVGLGAALLNEGKPEEAAKLLRQAAALEEKQGGSAGALILLIEAGIEAGRRDEALKLIGSLSARASRLPLGRQAAAHHAAGKLYKHLGRIEEARESLRLAVKMQPDDWVDEGGGKRYKRRGVASIYAKDLAAAELLNQEQQR